MGKVKWGGGVTADSLDNAERDQFAPYTGPAVPNGVYCWKIKVLRRGKSSGGHGQLIIGLELTPRRSRPEEKPYKGYFITDYIVVTEGSQFRVVRFLDGIGVTGREFVDGTITTGEANKWGSFEISKIGKWVNDGKQYILASLVDGEDGQGNPRREIGGYWPIPEESSSSSADDEADEEEELDEDEADDTEEDEADEEPEEAKPAKKAAKKATPAKATSRKRRDADEDEAEDDEPPF